MKKLFLFLGTALFSLGVSATTYDVVLNRANVDINSGKYNYEITDQLNGAELVEGDMYCIADNDYNADGEGGYWKELSAYDTKSLGKATVGVEFEAQESFEIIATGVNKTKYIVQLGFSIGLMDKTKYGTAFKMRPTEEALSVESATYDVALSTAKFGPDDADKPTNYKAEFVFETDAAMVTDDILKVSVNGKFNQNVNGLVFMVFDNDGKTVLGWEPRAFQAEKDVTVNENFELVMPKNCPTTAAKLGVFIEGYDAEVPISFLKDGDVAHDPVEVAKKEYTEVTLAYNQYHTPANYQFIEAEIASDVLVGDYVSFSVKGISSAAFTNMIAYLRNPEGYSEISSHVTVAQNIAANGEVTYTGVVEATSAAAKCDLVFEITDEATEGTSITIKEGSSSGPGTAVEEVASSAFAVVGGMVYSAGEIVVYNVAGKAIASAFQALNVNSLGAGVYFISAQEGTIKFVK